MPIMRSRDRSYVIYSNRSDKEFWHIFSEFFISKYKPESNSKSIVTFDIAIDCYNFFTTKFKDIIKNESSLEFYRGTLYFLDQTIKIWNDTFNDYDLDFMPIDQFGKYQRTLMLILEQSVTLDLKNIKVSNAYRPYLIEKLEDLIFLGEWIYTFTSIISESKTVGDGFVYFLQEDKLNFERIEPYNQVFTSLQDEYVKGHLEAHIHRQNEIDIKLCISSTFGVDMSKITGLVRDITNRPTLTLQFSPTFTYEELIKEYCSKYKSDHKLVKLFFDGLILSRDNSLAVEASPREPNNLNRLIYRPFLELTIDGEKRLITTTDKIFETFSKLSLDAINWNKGPSEWLTISKFKSFLLKKEHDREQIFNKQIEILLKKYKIIHEGNIKDLGSRKGKRVSIEKNPGQIDYLLILPETKEIIVVECKYSTPRLDITADRTDFSNFLNYENKLKAKVNFVENHRILIKQQFPILSGNDININEFNIKGIFFVNTPIFYNHVGNFRAYHLSLIKKYIENGFRSRHIDVEYNGFIFSLDEPFFKNALQLSKSFLNK